MKKLVHLLLVSGAFITSAYAGETVYVNGKPVDPKIVNQAMDQLKKNPMAAQQLNNPKFKTEMLQSIGMQQAVLAEGNSQGFEKSPEYQAKLNEIKPMIYAQIMQEKANSQPISDAMVKARYEQMKEAQAKKLQYDVSHILVKDDKTAKDVIVQLNEGAKFSDLAKKYSTDPGSKDNGGDLGWAESSSYVPEFSAAMLKLKKGHYTTTPVKSQYGYHVIELNDVKPVETPLPEYAKMKDQIRQQIQMERTKKFFDNLKDKDKVEVK